MTSPSGSPTEQQSQRDVVQRTEADRMSAEGIAASWSKVKRALLY